MIIEGKVHRFGRDVDTDVIIPATYLTTFDPEKLAVHCMEPLDPAFADKVSAGDIMVAEENFGCGSSREHAPIAIKGAGIACVVAKSFARIFYRNAINTGLPIIENHEVVDASESGDILRIDTDTGVITNVTKGKTFQAQPFGGRVAEIIASGGLIEYTRERVAGRR